MWAGVRPQIKEQRVPPRVPQVKHKPYTLEKVTAANKEESEELDKARSAVQRSTRGRGRAAKAGGSAGGSGAKGRKHKGDGKAGGKGSRGKNAAREEEEEVPPTPAKAARGRGKGAKRKAAAPVSPKKGMATRSSKMRARRA